MKKVMFLLMIITLSGCYLERGIYVHRHPWNKTNRVHKYYVPRPYQKYEAPSRVYKNRSFK